MRCRYFRPWFLLFILFLLARPANAAALVGFDKTGTISVAELNRQIAKTFGASSALPKAKSAVDLYKIRYRSRNLANRVVVLSGLLALPRAGVSRGLVLFHHGTMADRNAAPSRYRGNDGASEAQLATLAFAAGGYAVAMPDYLGLGDDTSNTHPYPLGKSNCLSAIDMILPARAVIRQIGRAVASSLFVAGYSEGGGVAMWTTRILEQKPIAGNLLIASVPMSGPYDLSGATVKFLVAPPANSKILTGRLYLMAYLVHSFQKSKGVRFVNYFSPGIAFAASQAFSANRTDEAIIKRLGVAAALTGAKTSMDRILTRRFRDALTSGDTRDPVIAELPNHDSYNWKPRTKMLLVALESDALVTSENTETAMRAMRKNGVGANTLRRYILRDNDLNHISAMAAALVAARRFFDSGFAGVPGATP